MNWINPYKEQPEIDMKVIIAAPQYTAIGYWDGSEWFRWIDFPSGGKPVKCKKEHDVWAWQPLPKWKHEDFDWLKG